MRRGGFGQSGLIDARLPRKASWLIKQVTVSETDTGGKVEYTKARERNLVKELGTLAPYLR
jgi:hypothetical protein